VAGDRPANDRHAVEHAVSIGYGQAEAASARWWMVSVPARHKGVGVTQGDRHD
jgi:hypothetical protein